MLGEERANLSAFRTFVRFALVWICRFPIPLSVWEGLLFVIVALPGLFSYPFFALFSGTFMKMFQLSGSFKALASIIRLLPLVLLVLLILVSFLMESGKYL